MAALDDLFEFTSEFAGAHQLGERESFVMNLAVEELFTNIVKCHRGGGSEVSVELDISGDNLVVKIIEYDAERFDVTQAAPVDVNKPLAERRVGGLGLYLVRNLVDEIAYDYKDRTSSVTLVKRLEGPDVRHHDRGRR
jgi:anti-sigma regulatory factor (Ser/Thr protein kinase)